MELRSLLIIGLSSKVGFKNILLIYQLELVWTREHEKYFLEGGFWSFCAINKLNSSAPTQCFPMTYLFYGDGSLPNAIKDEWRIIELRSTLQ